MQLDQPTRHCNLATAFLQSAAELGDSCALRYGDQSISYSDITELAFRVVALLNKCDVTQGDVVAIASRKTVRDYAVMLGCILSGVTYTNLDPAAPAERSVSMLRTCQSRLLFDDDNNESSQELAYKAGVQLVTRDELLAMAPAIGVPEAATQIDGGTIAYIMFTSGSTGIPKGVAVAHSSILDFIAWGQDRFGIRQGDILANVSPMYFDNSVFDFFVGLFSGATLAPIDKQLLADPLKLVKHVDVVKCTVWFSVPSLLIYLLTMRVLTSETLSSVRVFTFGGEGFPKTELKKLFDLYGDRAEFVNVYGPTETTCICSSYDITEADFENMIELAPIGRLNPNFAHVILENGERSNRGELLLLGPNVALGYYNDKERTDAVFGEYSDQTHYRKPMYRTGDLVETRNGVLHFLGRLDNQIKHMGYRIELDEIEGALNSLPDVQQAAVVYHRKETAFGRIVAFVVAEQSVLDTSVLKRALELRLPSYMQPGQYKVVDSLPKNANGKVDRKAMLAELEDG